MQIGLKTVLECQFVKYSKVLDVSLRLQIYLNEINRHIHVYVYSSKKFQEKRL